MCIVVILLFSLFTSQTSLSSSMLCLILCLILAELYAHKRWIRRDKSTRCVVTRYGEGALAVTNRTHCTVRLAWLGSAQKEANQKTSKRSGDTLFLSSISILGSRRSHMLSIYMRSPLLLLSSLRILVKEVVALKVRSVFNTTWSNQEKGFCARVTDPILSKCAVVVSSKQE